MKKQFPGLGSFTFCSDKNIRDFFSPKQTLQHITSRLPRVRLDTRIQHEPTQTYTLCRVDVYGRLIPYVSVRVNERDSKNGGNLKNLKKKKSHDFSIITSRRLHRLKSIPRAWSRRTAFVEL